LEWLGSHGAKEEGLGLGARVKSVRARLGWRSRVGFEVRAETDRVGLYKIFATLL